MLQAGQGGEVHASRALPQHCSAGTGQCQGVNSVTNKQRNLIHTYSALTTTPEPDLDSMDFASAAEWLGVKQREWYQLVSG